MKIAVAMSGGVDSSVAAALLKKAGHEIIGVTMRLYTPSGNYPDHIDDARKVADALGVPHHIIDLQDDFTFSVIADFCQEYSEGRTPNPCVMCNREIKFGALWDAAKGLGADLLATGHYARVEKDKNGKFVLKKGKDDLKGQGYFLCRLTQEQLSRTLFPVGDMTKVKVREMAVKMGLPTANRPDSQEICFVPENDHAGFLKEHFKGQIQPGPILDKAGKTLGQHHGIIYYTVGQRKGLNIASAEPLYVTEIDAIKNTIIVGSKEDTYDSDLVADNVNWIAGTAPEKPLKIKARIRYRHPEAKAMVQPIENNCVYVKFNEPQMAITPGQTVVFYDGEKVLGGGRIIKQGM